MVIKLGARDKNNNVCVGDYEKKSYFKFQIVGAIVLL